MDSDCPISRNYGYNGVKCELAENPFFLLLSKTLSNGGRDDRVNFSNFFLIFFAVFLVFLLGLHRCPTANLIDGMEPRWHFSKKRVFVLQTRADSMGSKWLRALFSFFNVNFKQKPFECTLLELPGTKYGFSAPFWIQKSFSKNRKKSKKKSIPKKTSRRIFGGECDFLGV